MGEEPNLNSNREVQYLLAGAQLNDSLLQSYRTMHLTVQSIFVAAGLGLFVAILILDGLLESSLGCFFLLALSVVALFTLYYMKRIILARGEDVNFWHRRLILAEQELPAHQRHFTEFKVEQQARRGKVGHLRDLFLTAERIKPEDVTLLVQEGLGHTRRVLDRWLFRGILSMWVLLALLGAGYTAVSITLAAWSWLLSQS